MQQPKFKIGSKVCGSGMWSHISGEIMASGETPYLFMVRLSDGSAMLFHVSNMRPAEPERTDGAPDDCSCPTGECPEHRRQDLKRRPFRPGDRVRILGNCKLLAGIPLGQVGQVGTVQQYDEVIMDNGTNWAFGGCEEVLEHVDAADPYAQHAANESTIAALQRADDEMSGRRAALVAALAAEHVKTSDSSGLLHPRSYWSLARKGRRRA